MDPPKVNRKMLAMVQKTTIKARILVAKWHQAQQAVLRQLLLEDGVDDVDGRGLDRHLDTRTYRKRFEDNTQSVPRTRIRFLSCTGQLATTIFLDEATFRKLYALTEPWLFLPFSFSENFYQRRAKMNLQVLRSNIATFLETLQQSRLIHFALSDSASSVSEYRIALWT